jgi:hypothetical protein
MTESSTGTRDRERPQSLAAFRQRRERERICEWFCHLFMMTRRLLLRLAAAHAPQCRLAARRLPTRVAEW